MLGVEKRLLPLEMHVKKKKRNTRDPPLAASLPVPSFPPRRVHTSDWPLRGSGELCGCNILPSPDQVLIWGGLGGWLIEIMGAAKALLALAHPPHTAARVYIPWLARIDV